MIIWWEYNSKKCELKQEKTFTLDKRKTFYSENSQAKEKDVNYF